MQKTVLTASLALFLVLPAAAFAQSDVIDLAEAHQHRTAAAAALTSDVDEGLISPQDARLERFYAAFRPDLVDPRYSGLSDGSPGCATEILADLRAHWAETSPEDKHLIELESSPIYRSWLSEGGPSWLEADVDAVRAEERSTCFPPSSANDNLGPYSEQTGSEHFVLHWNPTSEVDQGDIDLLLGWLEHSWQFQVVDRGFYQPHGLSLHEMLVVVEPLNNPGIGAYATISQCSGSAAGFMTYIVVNDWSFEDLQWLKSVAPHEFFHGVQIVYGIDEYWGSDTDNRWLIEASATYMQRVVFPDTLGVEVQQTFRWATEPHRSLETADETGLQYGLVIFLLSLEHSTETNEWHQALWDLIYGRSGYDLRDEFDEVLAEYDTDFLTEWRTFMIRGAVGPMLDNQYLITPLTIDERTNGQYPNAVVGEWDGRDYPIDKDVDSASGHNRPEYLGNNYVVFKGERIDDDIGAVVRFRGDGEKNGREVEWAVEMAAVYNDEVRFLHSMELSRDGDDIIGEVLVNEIGEDFDYVVMAVSPITDFGGGPISWSYTADLVDATDNGGFAPVPEEVDDEGRGCASCASSITGPASPAWMVLLPLVLLGRRRR